MSKIPAFLLEKDKPLTGEERSKVQRHTQIGYEMLSKLDLRFPEVEQCLLQHHERLGGSGYPQKLSDITEFGLLTAVVDSYCAMISERPYAKAMEPKAAAGALATDAKYDQRFTKQLMTYLVNTRQM